jgi:tetratricopeptide (TPR) repeat protein
VSRPQLFLSHDAHYDWLVAVEYGRVNDGHPPWLRRQVYPGFDFLLDDRDGREFGFTIDYFSGFGLPDGDWDPEVEEELRGRRFDVPTLMLEDAHAVEIAEAAAELFEGRNSVNRDFFDRATECGERDQFEQALYWWRSCLQAGDLMGLFGIGYTLHDLGRFAEGLPYLRRYAELAPYQPWTWCWVGRCAAALGRVGEARRGYRRAIELTDAGAERTDAAELLAALEG